MDAPENESEPEETTVPSRPETRITRSNDFKMIYVSGAFGSVNPHEGRITFYADRLFPKLIDDKGGLSTDYVERELQIELKMSPSEFLSLYRWMEGHVKKLMEDGINILEVEEPEE